MPLAFFPTHGLSTLALAIVLAGTGIVLAGRAIPKAYGLAAVCVAVFVLEYAQPAVGDDLALQARLFESGRQWWAPLTYMYVHADFLHIFGNLFILLTAGAALEEKMGEKVFLAVYFASGFAAAGAHLAMAAVVPAIVPPTSFALGASGAIFGVLTLWAVMNPKAELPMFMYVLVWLPSFVVLLIYLGINVVYMMSNTGVAWWGHFAGFVVGLAASVPLSKKLKIARQPRVDASTLAPLATTPEARDILAKLESMTGATEHDDIYAEAWLDKFVRKARCPNGHELKRDGRTVRCVGGEYVANLGR